MISREISSKLSKYLTAKDYFEQIRFSFDVSTTLAYGTGTLTHTVMINFESRRCRILSIVGSITPHPFLSVRYSRLRICSYLDIILCWQYTNQDSVGKYFTYLECIHIQHRLYPRHIHRECPLLYYKLKSYCNSVADVPSTPRMSPGCLLGNHDQFQCTPG